MSRGNFSNHPKKWAREEDLKELQRQFTSFVYNDFAGFQKELSGLKTDISWLKKLTIGLVMAVIAAALAIIISGM